MTRCRVTPCSLAATSTSNPSFSTRLQPRRRHQWPCNPPSPQPPSSCSTFPGKTAPQREATLAPTHFLNKFISSPSPAPASKKEKGEANWSIWLERLFPRGVSRMRDFSFFILKLWLSASLHWPVSFYLKTDLSWPSLSLVFSVWTWSDFCWKDIINGFEVSV